jgi:pyridoxine 4-dehydrogenase
MNAQSSAFAAGTIDIGGDLRVSRIGFGAMRITGMDIWGDPPDRSQAIAALRRVVELGVSFIDTADSYGPAVSEILIAEALHPYRGDLVIATKGGLVRPGRYQWERDGRPEHLRQACEHSLKRLRLEQIPLYQLHKPDPQVPFADSIGALADLKAAGKIHHIGVSTVTEDQLREAQRIAPIATVQNRYNASDRSSQPTLELCATQGIAFIPWAPVQQTEANPAVAAIGARHGATPYQVALAWLLAISPIILPIPGTGSLRHVEDNVAAASLELTADEIAAITVGTSGCANYEHRTLCSSSGFGGPFVGEGFHLPED